MDASLVSSAAPVGVGILVGRIRWPMRSSRSVEGRGWDQGGKAISIGGDNNKNTRDGVYRMHEVCVGAVPSSSSCRVRVPVGLEMGLTGSAGKSGVSPINLPARNCFPKNYVGGISLRNSVQVPRGDRAGADQKRRAPKWHAP